MQPQGLELMRLSLANIELVKKIIQFSTVFTTFFNGFGRSQNSKQPFLWFVKIIKPIPDSRGVSKVWANTGQDRALVIFLYPQNTHLGFIKPWLNLDVISPNLDVVTTFKTCRKLAVVIPIKPLGNLAVILMQQNEQNGQKYKGFANR